MATLQWFGEADVPEDAVMIAGTPGRTEATPRLTSGERVILARPPRPVEVLHDGRPGEWLARGRTAATGRLAGHGSLQRWAGDAVPAVATRERRARASFRG